MNAEYVVEFARNTVHYLNNDKRSFESVLDNTDLTGKLGFAMIATAMAAFDLFAWILYQSFDLKKTNKALYNELINDARFFDKRKYGNEIVFYGIIRCGVMHQLYPKQASISAQKSATILYNHGGILCINSYGLFCDVMEGCERIRDYLASLSEAEKTDYSLKLLLRIKIDEAEYIGARVNLSSLPELT
ncbi:MAG: hypothetical protein WCF59_02065 [Desulfobaccales bacterium]